jgi:threonine/homoserine/homoserine lactone efflux protein
MNFFSLFKGIIIGFSIAVPIGSIGILCIHRSLTKNRWSGFLTGLGAATADAFYGIIVGFGLFKVSKFIMDYKIWVQSLGIFLLLGIGIKTFLKEPPSLSIEKIDKGLFLDYLSALGLTIINPMTIIPFTTILVNIGLSNAKDNYCSAFSFALGIFLGSTLWWLILSNIIGLVGNNLNKKILNSINRISGIIIIIFAIIPILKFIETYNITLKFIRFLM